MKKIFCRATVYFTCAIAWLAIVAGTGTVLAADEVKIGLIWPLTGESAAAGRELEIGARLAQEIVNRQMPDLKMDMAKHAGIKSLGGAQIRLLFKDHKGDPALGAALAKELIDEENVHGIIGCYQSAVTRTVSQVCESRAVPMINGTSTSPDLTQRGFQWFWRTTPHDKWFTKDLFELLKGLSEGKGRGVNPIPKTDILNLGSACENSEWGTNVASLIGTMAQTYSFNLKKSVLYDAKSDDLSSVVKDIMSEKVDVMLFASYTPDAIAIIKQLKKHKAKPKLIWGQDAGFENPAFKGRCGYDSIGILTRTVFLPKVTEFKDTAKKVNAYYKHKKRSGEDMSGTAARAFTAMQTWVHVLESAGSLQPEKIQKAANALFIPGEQLVVPWNGVKFSISGDERGQNMLGSGLIGQYQKNSQGNIELQIIYPFEFATSDMIFPLKGF